MTISIAPARNEYTANAGQTIFNYTFKIFENTDLNVYITPGGQDANDSTDIITAYTVTGLGDEDGGTIILSTGTNASDLVTIVSNVPSSRTTDYQNNGDFRPDTVNADFDRVVSIAKKIEDIANRTVLLQQSQQDPKPLTLPSPLSQAIMRWKGDLTGLENIGISELSPGLIPNDEIVRNSTLTAVVSSSDTKLGEVYILSDRADGLFDVVLASSVTPNTFDIVQCVGVNTLALKLRDSDILHISMFGADKTGATLATGAIQAMYARSANEYHFDSGENTYLHDGSNIIVPEGTTSILGNNTFKLKAGTYTSNVFFFRNSSEINYNVAIDRMRNIRLVGGIIDGNAANVTMTAASTNAGWFHQCDNAKWYGPKIINLAGDNGGQPAIVFRFGKDCDVRNPDIANTDRQGIQFWETTGSVKGGSIGLSRFREPILISSENVPSFQGSDVIVEHVTCNNVGTTSGTHVIRFSGKSSGAVKHCDLTGENIVTGSTNLEGVYVTFGLEHNVTIEDNDIRSCAVGLLVDTAGTKFIKSVKNRYTDCLDGFNVGGNADFVSEDDRMTGVVERPVNVNFVKDVCIRNLFTEGGSEQWFFGAFDYLTLDNSTVKDNTDAGECINLSSSNGVSLATISNCKGVNNTANTLRASINYFDSNNEFTAYGSGGIRLARLGGAFTWTDSSGNLRIDTAEPSSRDSDGVVVGTQT